MKLGFYNEIFMLILMVQGFPTLLLTPVKVDRMWWLMWGHSMEAFYWAPDLWRDSPGGWRPRKQGSQNSHS